MKADELKEILLSEKAHNDMLIKEHNELIPFITKHEGKKFSNRLKLPEGYTMILQFGIYYIVSNNNIKHLIVYESDRTLSIENFEKFDAYNGSARIKDNIRIDELLQPETFNKMLKLYDQYETAYNNLIEVSNQLSKSEFKPYTNPLYYSLLKKVITNDDIRKAL